MKKITFLLMFLMVSIGFSQPTDNATPPQERNASDVISIFSGEYTNVVGSNFNPNWGQSGFGSANTAFDPGTGDIVLAYPNFNYQGVQFGSTQNISAMEFLHVDIWINGTFNPNVYVISSGAEIPHAITNTGAQTWISVDIPVSGITGNTDGAIQFKFDGGNGSSDAIYVDNLYFWRTAVDPLTDASLSSLEVDNSSVPGFGPGTLEYTITLLPGQSVPQITSATTTNPNATTVITQATSAPGSGTVVVTAEDGVTTETYTVNFIVEGPTTAAPTPPARPAADVISIFSDAYTDISVDTYDTPWCPGTTTEVLVDGNPTKRVSGLGCEGIDWQSARPVDASGFTHYHMDFFIPENTDLDGKVFNVKFSQWGGGAGEVSALEINLNTGTNPAITTGWNIIDLAIPATITAPFAGSLNRNDIVQFVISSNIPTIYYDNLYLHKNTVLSTDEFSSTDFRVYPNPSNLEWNVEANSTIKSISLVNILGKQVLNLEPNSSNFAIDNTNLATGLYFATIATENGSSVVKLIKN